jgi:hypothetical protein
MISVILVESWLGNAQQSFKVEVMQAEDLEPAGRLYGETLQIIVLYLRNLNSNFFGLLFKSFSFVHYGQ